jgi:hypothetical protein
MDEQKESKAKTCWCSVLLGPLVIVFAWWKVSWAALALTVLGVLILAKALVNCCCCKGKSCKV